MRTHVNLKAAALSKVIGLTVLAIAIGCFGYRWHRAVSAQSPTDGVNRERPEAVAHARFYLHGSLPAIPVRLWAV